MADNVQNTIESQKRFISDAAHELKTPLASMKTSVTAAMDSEKSPQECQELLSFPIGAYQYTGGTDRQSAVFGAG